MKKKKISIYLTILLLITAFVLNYSYLDSNLEGWFIENLDSGVVTKVVDGDTVDINGERYRLLGINTPEKGEKYYSEAKEFLEDSVLNKTVNIEFGKDRKDRYGRNLAYIYRDDLNINKKIIEEGYGNYYFPSGKDTHYSDFVNAWTVCDKKEINLCEPSEDNCSECITVRNINLDTQTIGFHNNCKFSCNLDGWEVKDEGRKKFVFKDFQIEGDSDFNLIINKEEYRENTEKDVFWNRKDYVWTYGGDTLFLRDSEGKLVLWKII